MTELPAVSDLPSLHAWFASYCDSFRTTEANDQQNYDLKQLHTEKVCAAARRIAQGGNAKRLKLAEAAAVCHDLGRFPQYRDYRTFKDADSVNHATLSAQVAEERGILAFLSPEERKMVLTAVRLHNLYQVPAGLPAESAELLTIVRDADKIDIWRVFADYFSAPLEKRPSAATLGFPDLPGCSAEVLAAVAAGRMAQLAAVKRLNDFKLLQLSWVYDINHLNSFRLIKESGALERLAALLPEDPAVGEVVRIALGYVEQRLQV